MSLKRQSSAVSNTLVVRKDRDERRWGLACGLPQVAQVDLNRDGSPHHFDEDPDARISVEILVEYRVDGGHRAALDEHRLTRTKRRLRTGQLAGGESRFEMIDDSVIDGCGAFVMLEDSSHAGSPLHGIPIPEACRYFEEQVPREDKSRT